MKNSISYHQQHEAALNKIISALSENAPTTFKEFVAQFYSKLPVSELEQRAPTAAVELAQSCFDFMQKRTGAEPKIRLVTAGKHSILELINDDMPFLVDSISTELTRRGITIYDTIHPILQVSRDGNGVFTGLGGNNARSESLIHFKIANLPDEVNASLFTEDLLFVLANIRASVEDWEKIIEKANLVASSFAKISSENKEVRDFLLWLADKNFVFLGYAEYEFFDAAGNESLHAVPNSSLGILRIDNDVSQHGLAALPPEMRHFLLVPQLIEITKSNRRSLVHRNVPMDYIGIKRFDKSGKVIGEARFLGLFTSNVYYQSTESIPLVRGKVARVLERSEFSIASHDGKSLKAILEFLPRDEIFQMSEDELFETSMGILALEAKPCVKMFARKDAFERFVSAMIFVPRERFSTELRKQIQVIVESAYNGTSSAFSTQITEAPLARLHLTIRTTAGDVPEVNLQEVEQEIAKRAYQWTDLLRDALLQKLDENLSEKFAHIYADAFPQSYINRYEPNSAVYDIQKIETAVAGGELELEFFQNSAEGADFFHLKIYNPNVEIALSDILPLLENAGFRVIDENPFLITPKSHANVWIRDFRLHNSGGVQIPFAELQPLLEDALLKIWRGEVESDKFNSLILKSGLNYKQVTMLRAYAKYLKQIGFSHGQVAIEQAFLANPQIAKTIVEIFENRFSPAPSTHSLAPIEEQLANVTSAIHDQILRRYVDLINATWRTNYYQTIPSPSGGGLGCGQAYSELNTAPLPTSPLKGEEDKPVLSFKFNSSAVPELPKPLPYAEIFVYSPVVEGIHLRGGKVARGGLRWSDRADDFRTEVLGLMKAQMVKNSVIVPVGSKGGFYVKNPPITRDALMAEGIECYKLYLSGLLDITDNIVGGKIVPPENCVRHDGDDPYLVVAADKGTASFSDIANSVSSAYNFWLGDAFASGGSVGYDHKKMAITARGAFISVRRHFSEMGVDIDKTPFTTVGIGDMAGDVFGNGMLLSENIRLVAAFNHLHIFIDPTPNEKTSFAERKRLFNLPRSNWTDYEQKLISQGGGIYERSAKSITISKQAMVALGVDKATFTPDELIRAIILAPVDLLWNGGIGTYAKAEDETNDQVGDRANNAVRVNGRELRCKIIGEGGNLGFTQKGRIEYARYGAEGHGGRINTDAIDNSAGVDCSDHEVNIKIAFSGLVASGKLPIEKRDEILASMTDEVAELVLKDNILQTQAITIAESQGADLLDSQTRLIHYLEERRILNRSLEFLPADKELADLQVAKKGLTRPELAVLLSYSKMELYHQLLDSELPDDAYFISDLNRYFPKAMREEFVDAIASHPLRREIIATSITNSIVNRAGISFAFDMAQDMGASLADVTATYVLVRELFKLQPMWQETKQAEDFKKIQLFVERACAWLLRNVPHPISISAGLADFTPAIAELKISTIADLERATVAFDIITIARASKKSFAEVEKIYGEIDDKLHFPQLRLTAGTLPQNSKWDRLAVQKIIGDLYDEQNRLVMLAINGGKNIGDWVEIYKQQLQIFDNMLKESNLLEAATLPKIIMAQNCLQGIV